MILCNIASPDLAREGKNMTGSNQNWSLPHPPEKRTEVTHFYMEPKGRLKVLNTTCGNGGEQEVREPEKPLKL